MGNEFCTYAMYIDVYVHIWVYYETQNYVGRKIDTLKVSQKWMKSKWTKISFSVLGTILEHWFLEFGFLKIRTFFMAEKLSMPDGKDRKYKK